MINIHLNGDIVRCPDIAAIHRRAAEMRDLHRICKYNYHEDSCEAWQASVINFVNIKKNGCAGRCMLSGTEKCPGHLVRKEQGKKEKTYTIDNSVYRKISSGAHYMVKESRHKTLFLTLTFPNFRKNANENQINECFSRFMDNLHKNYNVKHYIAVRENGEENGRVHFHTLLSIKYVDFRILNRAWCYAISDYCDTSKNAVQSDSKTRIIQRTGYALRYCCKYFSKNRGAKSKSRLVFMSMPLVLKHKNVYTEIRDMLETYKSVIEIKTSDYTTLFRITDHKEFDTFCNLYLYDLFNLSDNKTDFCGRDGEFY